MPLSSALTQKAEAEGCLVQAQPELWCEDLSQTDLNTLRCSLKASLEHRLNSLPQACRLGSSASLALVWFKSASLVHACVCPIVWLCACRCRLLSQGLSLTLDLRSLAKMAGPCWSHRDTPPGLGFQCGFKGLNWGLSVSMAGTVPAEPSPQWYPVVKSLTCCFSWGWTQQMVYETRWVCDLSVRAWHLIPSCRPAPPSSYLLPNNTSLIVYALWLKTGKDRNLHCRNLIYIQSKCIL